MNDEHIQIEIRDQVTLGMSRTLAMTVNGMRHRLGRSIVTILVIVVAIAFLMNTLSESLVKDSVAGKLDSRIAELRATANLASHLSQPDTREELLHRLARARTGDGDFTELKQLGGLNDKAMIALGEQAAQAAGIMNWLQSLDYGQHRQLLHDAQGLEVFERLSHPGFSGNFEATLASMPSVRLPVTPQEMDHVLAAWPTVRAQLERIRSGWKQAAEQVAATLGDRTLIEALAEPESDIFPAIQDAGFQLDEETVEQVGTQAREMIHGRQAEQAIDDEAMQIAIAQKLDILPGQVDPNLLWRFLHGTANAAWFLETMGDIGLHTGDLTKERLVQLSGIHSEERDIASVAWARDSADRGILDQRLAWFIAVSLIVCMVGITNAMLMSVTQRFREIATMKCLGALDGYIAVAFILEACMLGLIGGLLGAVLGLFIGVGRMFGAFGPLLFGAIPSLALLQATGIALLLGVTLAALSTVLPALQAARLAPMEAMRVE